MWWRPVRRLGLWARMAITLTLGFLVLLVVFFFLGNWALQDSARHVQRERLIIAQMTAAAIDNVIAQAVRELEMAPQFADFDPTSPELAQEADVLRDTYGRIGAFTTGIAFLDASGRVVLGSPADLYPPGTSLADAPHVQEVLRTGEVSLSEPFLEPRSGRPVVAITVPIYAGNGSERLQGILLGLLDLNSPPVVDPLHRAATLGVTGHAMLLDPQARVIVATLPLPFMSPGEHLGFYRRSIHLQQPVVQVVDTTLPEPDEPVPHDHLMALAPLSQAPWAVAVGGDAEEIFDGVNRLRTGLTVVGLVTLVVIWGATLVGARMLVRPVQRLTKAAQQIAAGKLDTPLHAPEGGEIGAMVEALDTMRQQLLQHIEALSRWNERLEEEVRARTAALERQQTVIRRLLQKVITAQEEERSRIARELHDEIGQALTALRLGLNSIARYVPADTPAAERLRRLDELVERSIADLRRLVTALRPGTLDQLGLVPAVRWMADQTLAPLGIRTTVAVEGTEERLPPEIEIVLFRIAQEGITNIARHSQAHHARIHFRWDANRVMMTIEDDGQGFSPEALEEAVVDRGGLGLAGMRERAALLGGTLTVHSAPGQGTRITVVIPLDGSAHNGKEVPE